MSRPKYGLEFAIDKSLAHMKGPVLLILRELKELIKGMNKFFFVRPRTKKGTIIYMVTISPFILLVMAIIWKI